MPLSDYAHWNEDAQHMWWQEEGRHIEEPPDDDPYDDRGYADYDPDEDEYEDDGYDGPIDPTQPGPFDEEPHIPEDAHLEQAYEDSQLGYFRED